MHLKPYVSYLEYGNALGVWRSSSLLLYSLCTSLETDDISSWSEWYVSVVYSCWFLDDGNIHSYRIRYHDSCLGRAIKKLCFLDSVFMLLRVRSVSVPRCINAVEPAVQSGNAIKKFQYLVIGVPATKRMVYCLLPECSFSSNPQIWYESFLACIYSWLFWTIVIPVPYFGQEIFVRSWGQILRITSLVHVFMRQRDPSEQ